MKFILYGFFCLQLIGSVGCGISKKVSSSFPESGRFKNISERRTPVFVQFEDDSVKLYAFVEKDGHLTADKTNVTIYSFPQIKFIS